MLPSLSNYEESCYKHLYSGFFVDMFWTISGKYQGEQLLYLPKKLYHFVLPSSVNENFCCTTSFPAFGVFSVVDFCHLNSYVVVFHCHFNLPFPTDIWCCFSMLICHLDIFFGKVSIQNFFPFKNWSFLIVKLWTFLYILDCSLSDISNIFANIFLPSVAYLLTLLTVSPIEQKF